MTEMVVNHFRKTSVNAAPAIYLCVADNETRARLSLDSNSLTQFAAQRLNNGRTLVTSINANQVYELDRSGKQVWQANLPGPSWRARRR